MGGAGKTALAVELAHQLRREFPDGVLWAHAGEDEPLDILQSWALAYDKDLSKIGSAEARAAAMRNILATRRALIVLDSVVAGRDIDLLLPGAANCPVLITTRDVAEVAARTTQIVELPELATGDSLHLLAYFLGEQAVEAEQEAAVALCTILGGLPLAVEIAAQRIFASPRRSLARMVRSLQAAGDRLAHGISNRSVRTSFNVSWEALPPDLQRIFALSGLFDGRAFSLPALAAAAGVAADDIDEAGEQLDQLVTLSMLKLGIAGPLLPSPAAGGFCRREAGGAARQGRCLPALRRLLPHLCPADGRQLRRAGARMGEPAGGRNDGAPAGGMGSCARQRRRADGAVVCPCPF